VKFSRLIVVVAATVLLPLLAACGGNAAAPASSAPVSGAPIGAQPTGGEALAGTSWVLMDGPFTSDDLAASGITLEFAETELSGSGGVNRYFGGYTSTTDGSLQIGVLASTEMAGDEAAMALEQEYFAALQSIFGYTIEDGTLTLVGAADQVLTYTAA
jgi:heat shock protein HslJ